MFDLVLEGGEIIDGTGAPRMRADVGIAGDRVAAIGDLREAKARRRIAVAGRVIAPGFIDTHTHDDRAVLVKPDMAMKTSQGVTTVVVGNCGISLAPSELKTDPPAPLDLLGDAAHYEFRTLADYFSKLDAAPPAVNVVALVGHMTLRASSMHDLDRPADAQELERMRTLLETSLQAGAVGLSTGLAYKPSSAAPSAEVVDLLQSVRQAGGMHCTHIRDEADGVMRALCEACAIGTEAGVPTLVSHHKIQGKRNAGLSASTLSLLDEAAKRQRIAIDAYPYDASSTVIRLDRVRQSRAVQITWSRPHPETAGRMLHDIAAEWNVDVEAAAERLLPGGAIYFVMDPEDVERILAWPATMIGSDGLPHDDVPHPRLWGTFPRVLGRYVRERGLMPLEQAVHRMTGLPARTFGLRGRGCMREGSFADLVVFDPQTVCDRATYASPTTPAAGIDLVLVNGLPVFESGASTGHRPGRVLRRQELDPPMQPCDQHQQGPA